MRRHDAIQRHTIVREHGSTTSGISFYFGFVIRYTIYLNQVKSNLIRSLVLLYFSDIVLAIQKRTILLERSKILLDFAGYKSENNFV